MSEPLSASESDLKHDHTIDPDMLSDAAVSVTRTLHQAGFEALLVGGCVRDLLLGYRPKDYDVATDATPEQVQDLFRRSRIIGRRFRIVHVRMGREIIEVTTFRGAPEDIDSVARSDRGRILADNTWGDLDSDAQRRDFTINALYYDPITNEGIDHVDGLADLEDSIIRVIGEPYRRFAEDPVRLLRAVRFMAKLGFDLSPESRSALEECVEFLGDVPAARLFDEVLKVFHNGRGELACQLLKQFNMLEILFPVLEPWLKDDADAIPPIIGKALANTDARVQQGKPVIAPFLFTAMLWMPIQARFEQLKDAGKPPIEALHRATDQVVADECHSVAIPRRVSSVVREILEIEHRLAERRSRSIHGLLENRRFRAAYDFMLLRNAVGERDDELVKWWTDIQDAPEPVVVEMISALKASSGKRRSRSRRTRKRKPSECQE
ncbi:MAG: poly(A) polymerase I [marine bacterium B5-7]|nr:MAG: poly(A) polymerase I [marine bacterium B5-7]